MEYIDNYLQELAAVVAKLPTEQLSEVAQLFLAARERGTHIFVMGNGGSAATASHMANDINKLTIIGTNKRFKALAVTDNVPLMTAWGNDSSFDDVFVEQLRHFLNAQDIVVGISTSGNSPNVVKAFKYAKQESAITVLFGGETAGKCADYVDYCVLTPSGHQGIQEDCHLIFNHAIANCMKDHLQKQALLTTPVNGHS